MVPTADPVETASAASVKPEAQRTNVSAMPTRASAAGLLEKRRPRANAAHAVHAMESATIAVNPGAVPLCEVTRLPVTSVRKHADPIIVSSFAFGNSAASSNATSQNGA